MTLKINGRRSRRSGHTQPVAPTISLDQPGRLRVAHVLALLSISHSTLYAGLNTGRYPKPDGYDGTIPYWNTETIRRHLEDPPPSLSRKRPRKPITPPPANLEALIEDHFRR